MTAARHLKRVWKQERAFRRLIRDRKRRLDTGKWWVTPRGRHSCDKGDYATQCYKVVVQLLSDRRFWAKHPEPFSKREQGKRRRAERRFLETQDYSFIHEGDVRCTHIG